jgi:nucleotide-binding universal stress UspA family protein
MKTSIETCEPAIDIERSPATKAVEFSRKPRQLELKAVLVPLDFSRPSIQTLKYTIGLAEEFKATVHLVHVQPTDEFTAVADAGNLMLNCADALALMQDRLAEVQREHDVRFWPEHCHVPSGRAYEEICKLARDLDIDLIILSTRGCSGLKHVVLGSTAERVVRFSPCPVLIPRGEKYRSLTTNLTGEAPRFQPHKILVPVDFSECCFVAVKYAARLATRFNSTLRLFHAVYPYAETMGVDRFAGDSTALMETARANAQLEMEALKQSKWLERIACETEVGTGYAVDEICAQSSRDDVDLVVTATHGRTGFKHALIGSVAEHVVRYAECPVISVPIRFNPESSHL